MDNLSNKEKYLRNFIGGKLIEPISGELSDNYNPATGNVYSYYPSSNASDLSHAVGAAENAFKNWKKTLSHIKTKFILRIADLIEQNAEIFANAESIDNGKPLSLTRSYDIPIAVKTCRFYGSMEWHSMTDAHPMSDGTINYTASSPLGVVSCILPWNQPLISLINKVIPVIITGNTVVVKPSEKTPYTAYLFSKICMESGLPAGVINIIYGNDVNLNKYIALHPKLKCISFSGSKKQGMELAKLSSSYFKKLFIETSTQNPLIIFNDCDHEELLRVALKSCFSNQGQTYTSTSNIYIESSFYEKFKHDFVSRTNILHAGDPTAARTRQGAIPSKEQYDKILSYIDKIKKEGGKILCGGEAAKVASARCKNGWFIEPTIAEGIDYTSKLNKIDLNSPVVKLFSFKTINELYNMVNERAGLATTIFTSDINKANTLAKNLKYGMIWINDWNDRNLKSPYGAHNRAGIGKEGGLSATKFYSEVKNICIKPANT